MDIGESLVAIGFGNVIEKPLKTDPADVSYFNKLKAAEERALKKRLGIRYYIKPTKMFVLKLASKITQWLNSTQKQKPTKKLAVT